MHSMIRGEAALRAFQGSLGKKQEKSMTKLVMAPCLIAGHLSLVDGKGVYWVHVHSYVSICSLCSSTLSILCWILSCSSGQWLLLIVIFRIIKSIKLISVTDIRHDVGYLEVK